MTAVSEREWEERWASLELCGLEGRGRVRGQVGKLGGRAVAAAALRNGKRGPSPALAMCLPLLSLEISCCPQDRLQNHPVFGTSRVSSSRANRCMQCWGRGDL